MIQKNLLGKTVLGYTVVEKLGSGTFGTVYKAVKTNPSGQYVRALKHITIPTEKQYLSVLNSMGGDTAKADGYFTKMLENILEEIRNLNSLSEKDSRYIVRYYENDILTQESPKRYDIFILMEYLAPLEDFLHSQPDFRVQDVIRLGTELLEGLDTCHQSGIIHRDVKEENIFVSQDGHYKIGDFGVSKLLKGSVKAESMKGTPNSIAPEVYLGREGYTQSVDLYSLGIVLYRLLNYGRNPFLPPFPEQYFEQNEDDAFQRRISGEIPPPPALGGEAIGAVVVRAISNSAERYQTAKDFEAALNSAVSRTPAEALEKKISVQSSPPSESSRSTEYAATLGEPAAGEETAFPAPKDSARPAHRNLFEIPGESPVLSPPPVGQTQGKLASSVPFSCPVDDGEELEPLDRKIMGKLVFVIPVLLLLIGAAAYFFIIPHIYGKAVSFIDWLVSDPQDILAVLREPDAVLPQLHGIIGVRIFWWIWLAALIASLFFVGKCLQRKPAPDVVNAILIKREPYFAAQEISAALRLLKLRHSSPQLTAVTAEVKRLEERLSVESDFGVGGPAVIACENQIAQQLQFLMQGISSAEPETFEQNAPAFHTALTNLNSLLHKRAELKRR